jgi:hypothetical protein
MATLEYLRAKTADYAVVLSRIARELQDLEGKNREHYCLLVYLQGRLRDAQTQHSLLKSIVELGHSRLLARALPIVHDIELSTFIISYRYLPALQKEGKADLVLRKLLLSSASQCGLSWVKDIAVHLDGPLMTVPIPEVPLIIAPPLPATSLLDLPGLYHELGHNVFQKFPEIASALSATVSLHFNKLRQKSGPIDPGRKAERDNKINGALQYWDVYRLNEIFCDIFGTFACGPSHYVSCVDMGLRSSKDPYRVDLGDEHPPLSARVYVCYEALTPAQQSEQSVLLARNAWENYTKTHTKAYDFNLICAEPLLDSIVEVAIRSIKELLPDAKRYEVQVPNDNEVEQIQSDTALEDILNRAATILLTRPERYPDWEAEAFKTLGFYA